MTVERVALFGADHRLFDTVATHPAGGGRSALAISPGGTPGPAFFTNKGDWAFPNEDACCVVEDGARTLLAVADAHFGREASQALIEALCAATIGTGPGALDVLLRMLDRLPVEANPESATTLAVVLVDRESGTAHGVSFGDSSLVLVEGEVSRRAIQIGRSYVAPGSGLGRTDGELRWDLTEGQLIVLHSDGVDEAFGAGGGVPPERLAELARTAGGEPLAFARAIADAALAGDGEHDGGGDNLAIAVTRV